MPTRIAGAGIMAMSPATPESAPHHDHAAAHRHRRLRFARRTIRRLLLYAVALLIIVGLGGSLYDIRSDQFRLLAKGFLESMYNRRIEVGEASVNLLGRVTLRDVKVYNPEGYASPLLLSAPRIYCYLGMTGGKSSAFRPTRIRVDEPELWFERPDSLPWNTQTLWVEKPAQPLPTYQLPITVHRARVHFSDSTVGRSGLALSFENADIDYTLTSDGNRLQALLASKNVTLPQGGAMDVRLTVLPATRRASVTLQFHDIDLLSLRPYYDFLTMFAVRHGRADVEHHLEFDGDSLTAHGVVKMREAAVQHLPSGRLFSGVSPEVVYHNVFGDTTIGIDTVVVRWLNSVILVRGAVSRGRGARPFVDLTFTTKSARAEDLVFLLCDPLFEASGPLQGSCTYRTAAPAETPAPRRGLRARPPAAPASAYEADIVLDDAVVRYARTLSKERGMIGRMHLVGDATGRPIRIAVTLGQSTAELTPIEGGWRMQAPALETEEVIRYFPALARERRLKVGGTVAASLNLRRGGEVSGNLDFGKAEIEFAPFFHKPRGKIANIDIAGVIVPGGFETRKSVVFLGRSVLNVTGAWTASGISLNANLLGLNWDDISRFSPLWAEQTQGAFEGLATGEIAVHSINTGEDAQFGINARLNLDRTAILYEGLWRKAAGEPAGAQFLATLGEDGMRVGEGEIFLRDTRLSLRGAIEARAFNLTATGMQTGLDGLRAFIASQLCQELDNLSVTGRGDVEIDMSMRDDEMKLSADINGYNAMFFYGDSWSKAPGESFRIRTLVSRAGSLTHIERLELTQGTSSLVMEGDLRGGRSLNGTLRAHVHVPSFLEHAPALQTMMVGNYCAADALRMVADGSGRAELYWSISGTPEQPQLSLDTKRLAQRVAGHIIAKQFTALTRLVFAPVRVGGEFAQRVFLGGPPTAENP